MISAGTHPHVTDAGFGRSQDIVVSRGLVEEKSILTTPPRASVNEGHSTSRHVTVIAPRASAFSMDELRELWRYRELLWFIAVRDVKLRYRQTLLGAAWAVLQPALAMAIFSVFFGRLAKVASDGAPYPLFVLCALLPWQLFAFAFTQSSNSIVNEQRLITKVYFPRLIVPIASTFAGMVDFAISLVLLFGLMAWYGVRPGAAILLLPVLVLFAVLAAVSVGLWVSALNVRYRDFRYTIPFFVQVWLFASPVVYSTALVPERWRALYGLNPMVTVIDGFRWALLGTEMSLGPQLSASIGIVLVIFAGGVAYFRRMERGFADIV